MRSTNPFLTGNAFKSNIGSRVGGNLMTINGTTNKTILLMVLVILGVGIDGFAYTVSHDLAFMAGMIAMIIAFVVSIVGIYKPDASPVIAPIYAVVEGIAVGAVSFIYGTTFGGGLVAASLLSTMIVVFVMAMAYRTGLIRATPMYVKVVLIGTAGLIGTYFLSFLLGFMGLNTGVFGNGPIGLAVAGISALLAAAYLILDFTQIEQSSKAGAPAYMEWYCAMSLLITIVWLYLSMLRLLSRFSSNN